MESVFLKIPPLALSSMLLQNRAWSSLLPLVIPQGSVLGPLHFLISTNDVTCVVSDNIALFQVMHTPNDFILVKQNINFIYAWVYQALLLNKLNVVYFSQLLFYLQLPVNNT